MLETVIKKIRDEFNSLRQECREIHQGYQFGKYLAKDLRQKLKLVANGVSNPPNEIKIVFAMGEYLLAWEDVRMVDGNPHSLGVVLYGATHKKDDEMITDLWNYLKNSVPDSKIV